MTTLSIGFERDFPWRHRSAVLPVCPALCAAAVAVRVVLLQSRVSFPVAIAERGYPSKCHQDNHDFDAFSLFGSRFDADWLVMRDTIG